MPEHEIMSAGINSYFTNKHGTTHISDVDLAAIDFFIFCENVQRDITYKSYFRLIEDKPYIVLNLGHFEKDDMNKYVEKAMSVLSFFNSIKVRKHWGDLVFNSAQIIVGKGLVLVLDLKLNEIVEFDYTNDIVVKIGDTFDYKQNKYEITGIEVMSIFDNKKKSTIGLIVKKIEG
jgi:hypothetical protein